MARKQTPVAEPAPRKTRASKSTLAEATPKDGRAAYAKEDTTVKRSLRSTASEEVVVTPSKRSRSKAVAEEVAPAPTKRRSSRVREEDIAEEQVKKTRRSKAQSEDESEEKPVKVFNPYGNIDDMLDDIDKKVGLSDSGLDRTEQRLSTGLLMLDIILGGGITAGWYTNFGQEQSCKTTGAVTILAAALNSNVPLLSYWDYEGCYTINTNLVTNFGNVPFSDILSKFNLSPVQPVEKSFFDVEGLEVETIGRMVKVDKLYYSGVKPVSRLTTESGKVFEGFAHPFLCLDTEGNLVYRKLENLKPGDKIVKQS